MKNKLQLGNVIMVVLILGVALASSVFCCRTPAPTSTRVYHTLTPVPTATPGPSPTPYPTPTQSTPGATVTPRTATPPPTPTMTRDEQALVTLMQHDSPQSVTSPDECYEVMKTEASCSFTWYAAHITRPEWEALFPNTKFILAKSYLYGNEPGARRRNQLIIEHATSRYDLSDFQRLLDANRIVVTDQNRELVAKAFVLMALPDYLDEDIVFSDWKEGSWPSEWWEPYNYTITAWTKIQGLKIRWRFLFREGRLPVVRGVIIEQNIGDYIDVSFRTLPPPSQEQLTYWSNR